MLGAFLSALPGFAAMPDYVREALHQFNPSVPTGWAYTVATVRNNDARATARFDPTKPPADRWTLLELNGRPPTEKELEQYRRARASAPTMQASFQKADIEPATIELIGEDAERSEFRCGFREAATGADKMLAHLTLRLTINKRQPHIEKYALELKEPYAPVLGVKMRELLVQMTFTAPVAGRPSLPATHTSHFLGRIFLIGTEENLVLTYTDFAQRP